VCCFTVVGVLFSLRCSKRTRTVVIVTGMSFVRWRHITFQYIQINCDFTLTMKLPWFLLNLVWLSDQHTSCKIVALYDALTTTQASIASLTSFFYDVFLHCPPLHVRNGLSFAYLWRVLGEFDPLNVVGHRADPKRHFLAWLHVIRVNVRENPPKDHFSRRVRGKKNLVTYLPRRTLTTNWHKFCVTCSSRGRNQLCKVLL